MKSRDIGSNRLFRNPQIATDSSVVYMSWIKSLLEECEVVVDVGCGRGAYADDTHDLRNIFDLRGSSRTVTGLDVDPAAQANPFIDRFKLLDARQPWPIDSDSADLIVSDWTLEHVEHPSEFVSEVTRALHIGGVFIARSVSLYSLLSIISRLIPNRHHATVLKHAQPGRRKVDIFPAHYRMNTPKAFAKLLADYDYAVTWLPGLEQYVMAQFPRLGRTVGAVECHLPGPLQTVFVLSARLRSK